MLEDRREVRPAVELVQRCAAELASRAGDPLLELGMLESAVADAQCGDRDEPQPILRRLRAGTDACARADYDRAASDLARRVLVAPRDVDRRRAAIVQRYASAAGDRAITARLPFYLAAYAAFRVGYCTLAAASLAGAERDRFTAARRVYERALGRALSFAAAPSAR